MWWSLLYLVAVLTSELIPAGVCILVQMVVNNVWGCIFHSYLYTQTILYFGWWLSVVFCWSCYDLCYVIMLVMWWPLLFLFYHVNDLCCLCSMIWWPLLSLVYDVMTPLVFGLQCDGPRCFCLQWHGPCCLWSPMWWPLYSLFGHAVAPVVFGQPCDDLMSTMWQFPCCLCLTIWWPHFYHVMVLIVFVMAPVVLGPPYDGP